MNFLPTQLVKDATPVKHVIEGTTMVKIGAVGTAGSWTLFGVSLHEATQFAQFLSAVLACLVSLVTLAALARRWCKQRKD